MEGPPLPWYPAEVLANWGVLALELDPPCAFALVLGCGVLFGCAWVCPQVLLRARPYEGGRPLAILSCSRGERGLREQWLEINDINGLTLLDKHLLSVSDTRCPHALLFLYFSLPSLSFLDLAFLAYTQDVKVHQALRIRRINPCCP